VALVEKVVLEEKEALVEKEDLEDNRSRKLDILKAIFRGDLFQ